MLTMLPSGASQITNGIRPLKRVEYERLGTLGYFEDEHVELLFGMVVEMPGPDPAHSTSTTIVRRILGEKIGARAEIRSQDPFAASDISEPQPDVFVVPNGDYWKSHPERAYLIVEVSRSSLDRDQNVKALLYGLAEVDEYWIVNHQDEVVEVYRDRAKGRWRSVTTYRRGQTIAMLQFPDVEIEVSAILPPP